MNLFRVFDQLALWKKFTCLGVLCLAVVILPTLLYTSEVRQQIEIVKLEQQGLAPAQLMLDVIQRTQQHRGLSARFLADPNVPGSEHRKKAEELNVAMATFEQYLVRIPHKKIIDLFSEEILFWHQINQQVIARSISVEQSFQLHTALIGMQLHSLQMIIDDYQLSLDPESDGYFLISASLMNLPQLTEVLGQLRATGVGVLAKSNADFAERTQVKSLLLVSKNNMAELDSAIERAVSSNSQKRENIFENYRATQAQYQKILDLTQAEILEKETLTYKADDFYTAFTFAINSYYSYGHFAISQINNILQERILQKQRTMYALLFYIFCTICVTAFFCVRFVRKLLRELGGEPGYATQVVQAITRGDWERDVVTEHSDSLLDNMKTMQHKLKENERLKNEFVSTVSHELRTPLTAIYGALAVSLSGKLGDVPEAVSNVLGVAERNARRLKELINDLLDIDKLMVGKLELTLEVQPITPIVEDAVNSMASYAEKYGVNLLLTVQEKNISVHVDARRVQQVIVNLISNAAKFSPAGETVSIDVSLYQQKVRVEVIDHGTGVPHKFQERIFQKFSQADSSDTRTLGGTGLGLAIAKELIERMEGTIGFNSTDNVGACFYFELPLVSQEYF